MSKWRQKKLTLHVPKNNIISVRGTEEGAVKHGSSLRTEWMNTWQFSLQQSGDDETEWGGAHSGGGSSKIMCGGAGSVIEAITGRSSKGNYGIASEPWTLRGSLREGVMCRKVSCYGRPAERRKNLWIFKGWKHRYSESRDMITWEMGLDTASMDLTSETERRGRSLTWGRQGLRAAGSNGVGSLLLENGPIKDVVILMVQSAEQNSEQLAEVHVVRRFFKTEATAVVQIHSKFGRIRLGHIEKNKDMNEGITCLARLRSVCTHFAKDLNRSGHLLFANFLIFLLLCCSLESQEKIQWTTPQT